MLKELVEMAIKMGMTKFEIKHTDYRGKTYEQTVETVFDFIKGYEDATPNACYFGTAYGKYRPELCYITIK